MEPAFYSKLRLIHRVNRVLWLSVLAGMLVLIAVSLVFYFSGQLTSAVLQTPVRLDDYLMVLTVVLLLLIFYLKRTYLTPEALVRRAQNKQVAFGTGDIADLVNEFGEDSILPAKILIIMRRYFMLVWSIANVILLLGFTVAILTGHFQTFIIYSVVSLYTMSINFPAFTLIEQCMDEI